MTSPMVSEDTIVASVIEKFRKRSNIGVAKYGTTLDREDLGMIAWLNHAQEEHMDAILYLEKVRKIEVARNIEFVHATEQSANTNSRIGTVIVMTSLFTPIVLILYCLYNIIRDF